ncbi:hypothetical protein ACFO4E_02345 [Nocardiopsis mangrovi]|uniref:Lipoprotein n=1 Tax=Nocardiopsis mangrovi TaxID=1179818 RepID=A0ABV9DR95_9ACTN
MSYRGHKRHPLLAAVLFALLLPLAACGGQPDDQEPPALNPSSSPELRTFNPTPPVGDEPETTTIRQGQQRTIAGLNIAVLSTSGGEVRFSVNAGPGIDEEAPQNGGGSAGDTVDLDNGYAIAIDEVEDSAEGEAPGAGSGSVTLTITPPGD